jgi:Molybdopterin-binding domain of aldehyde dehydrogenase
MTSSDFERRVEAAVAFNAKSRWRKRGISCVPTKFGISFTTKFLNQAGALVHSASTCARSVQVQQLPNCTSCCVLVLKKLGVIELDAHQELHVNMLYSSHWTSAGLARLHVQVLHQGGDDSAGALLMHDWM